MIISFLCPKDSERISNRAQIFRLGAFVLWGERTTTLGKSLASCDGPPDPLAQSDSSADSKVGTFVGVFT
jgi:hypothetical protein